MGLLNSLENWLDVGLDVAKKGEEAIRDREKIAADQQIKDEAHKAAIADADRDWANGTANTLDFGGHHPQVTYVSPGSEPEITIPTSVNPFVAFLEVMFTPKEIHDNEEFKQQNIFNEKYQDSYRNEAIDRFDQQLNERLTPDPSAWKSIDDLPHNSIDNFVPPVADPPSSPPPPPPPPSSPSMDP